VRLVLTPDRWVDAHLDTDPEALAYFAGISLAWPDRILVLLEIHDEGASITAWFLPGPVKPDGPLYVSPGLVEGYHACPCTDCTATPEVITVRRRWRHRVPASVIAAAQTTT
jgi:hypothetical protein